MSSDLKPPIPSLPSLFNRQGGLLAPIQQLLGQGLGNVLRNAPFEMAPNIFNGTNVGPGSPFQGSTNQASTSASATPQTFTGPGGVSVPLPPTPSFTPNTSVAPTAPQSGGILGMAGNAIDSISGAVRNLLGPALGSTPAPPPASVNPSGGAPTGLAGALPDAAATIGRTIGSTLSGAPQQITQPAMPGAPQTSVTLQSGGTPQAAQMQAVPGQQPVATAQATPQTLQSQTAPQTGQQIANPLAQTSTAVPVPQQAPPARTDASLGPPGNPAADRAAPPQQAQAPVQPNVPSAPQGTTLLAAVPLATTVAQAPVAQQLAGNPQAQASGNPLAGTAALDAGGPVRAELTGTGTYTAEGPGLRRRERMKVGAQQMGQWMLAAVQGRLHLVRPHHDDSRHEAERVFQWLFWVLAIVAYGSLGLVLVAFLLSFGELPAAPTLRRWTGEFAVTGLLAAVGAWWLGRQLTRAARPPPDPIRR